MDLMQPTILDILFRLENTAMLVIQAMQMPGIYFILSISITVLIFRKNYIPYIIYDIQISFTFSKLVVSIILFR